MRREYKTYVNGAKITDGVNKIIVNGAECRRCLVNGLDIIKSFAQLKLRFTMTGTVDAYSWYLSDPDFYEDRSGYGSWNIASESVALLTNDFTINSFSFRFYVQDTNDTDENLRHFSPSRSTTTFPYTATNVSENFTTDTGGATTSKSYSVYIRISANITYVPTNQTFTVNSEDFLFDEGTIYGDGGESWSEAISFTNKTLDVLIEREVAQY